MDWSSEHEILFCREVIAHELYSHKPGSKERGQCLDRIAESLNSIENPYFKVDQRSLRDKIKKLLLNYVQKRNKEEKSSGIEVEHGEIDDLLLEIHEKQQLCEKDATIASSEKQRKQDQERVAAEEIRTLATERLSETRKRSAENLSSDESSPKSSKRRSSGGDTIAYLRDKSEKDFSLRGEEIALRKQELLLMHEKEENAKQQMEMLISNSQQQTNMMLMLVSKMAEKF